HARALLPDRSPRRGWLSRTAADVDGVDRRDDACEGAWGRGAVRHPAAAARVAAAGDPRAATWRESPARRRPLRKLRERTRAYGASLAIARGSGRKEAAWQLVEFLSEPAQQAAFYRLTGDLPARRTAWVDDGLASQPHARAFWIQLQSVQSTPKIPEWERIAGKITQYSEAAVRGDMTLDRALAALDRDVDNV